LPLEAAFPSLIGSSKTQRPASTWRTRDRVSIPHRKFKNATEEEFLFFALNGFHPS